MKHRDCMHKLFLTVPKGQGEKECGMHKMSSSTSVKTPVFMCIRGYVTFHLSAKWSGYHKAEKDADSSALYDQHAPVKRVSFSPWLNTLNTLAICSACVFPKKAHC